MPYRLEFLDFVPQDVSSAFSSAHILDSPFSTLADREDSVTCVHLWKGGVHSSGLSPELALAACIDCLSV